MSTVAKCTMHSLKDHQTQSVILCLILCCSLGHAVTIGFSDTTVETISEGATVTKDVCRDPADPTMNAVLFSLTVSRNSLQDAILPSGNSLLPAGVSCVAVEIFAFDDSMREDTETFQIFLSLPFPSTVDIDENQNQFILYIEDNDGTGTSNFCPTRTTAIMGTIVSCPIFNAVAMSVCTYQCMNGYKVVAGLLTRTCIPDTLRWTGNPPVCAPSSTPSTPVIINNCPTSPLTHTVSSNSPLPAFFNAPVPTTTDTSTVSVTGVPVNNLFPEGSTFITYTFTNDAGSQAVCIFTIIIDVDYCNPKPVVCQTGTTCVEGSPDQSQITCVENTAPNTPNCPEDTLYVAATQGSLTTVVQFGPFTCEDPDERDLLPATCVPTSGSDFSMGRSTVLCTCTDRLGEESHCTFDVIVAGNQAPGPPNCPSNTLYISAAQGSTAGTPVHYGPFTCEDPGNPFLTASCIPISGMRFPVGQYQVKCTCVDVFDASSECTFQVIVAVNTPPSNPVCPSTLNVPATQGITRPEAFYGPFSCSDAEEMLIPATCIPPSGTRLSIGQSSSVTCSCLDQFGAVGQCTFTVIVNDVDECATSNGHSCDTSNSYCQNTPGDYNCQCKRGFIGVDYTPPSPVTCQRDTTSPEIVSCPSEVFRTVQLQVQSISVAWDEPSARDDSMSVSISSQTHIPGSNFNVGRTTVTYIFSDPAGNTAECSFGVSVVQDCTVLYSNRQCDAGTCTCMDESCDLDTGVCRSSCTVMNCPADIESLSLSKVNPLSSVDITCTLRGSTAILRQLQLRLSNKVDGVDQTGISRLTEIDVNPMEKVESIFKVDDVTRETKLYCVLLHQNYVIGGVGVMDFVHELPVLIAAPIGEDVSNTSITIIWRAWDATMDNGDPPIVAYIPYYRMDASDVWISGPRILSNETLQFTADILEVDTGYDFSVAAVREGENGEGPRSPSVKVKTYCNVPDMAASVNVQFTSFSNNVNVSWQLPPVQIMCSTGVTSYKVYYRIEGSIDDTPQLAGTLENVDRRWFIIDDGLLEPGSSYIFFVTVTTDQESVFTESELIQAQKDTSAPVYLISLIIIPVLVIAVIVFIILRYRKKESFKNKKGTKADDGEDTDYVNAAIADDPEDYIPLKGQSRTVSSSRCEDLNLEPHRGASVPTQYEVTLVPKTQKPAATPRYQYRNVKGVNSGAYEDVAVSSENRQLPDVPQSHPSAGDEDEDNSYEVPDRLEEYTGVYINVKAKPIQPGSIKVAAFHTFMSRNKEDVVNDVVQQFMALPSGRQYPCSVALKFQNKPRNFFKTILAYDHSRVELDTNGSDARSDYINASYIKNQQAKTAFIAAQGPQEGTVDDFWKMVWQENVETIVMVTDNIGKNKLLCCTYWPEKVRTSEVFGDISVLLMESTSYTTHTIRKLNLFKGNQKTVHTVTQVYVHSWPYGGVPKEPASLISIIKKVKSLQKDGSSSPLLVHCSNGVGATGTFIAVYVLMDTIKKNKDVNVFDFVKRMREDRVDMVQTRIQYLFIFECLLAVLQSTDSEISCDQLKKLGHAAIKLKAKKEYKVLQESVKAEQHFENYDGNSSENQHKNRFKDIIPVDKFRPVLKSGGSTFGSNSYINAILLTDFGGREFIMTQVPLSSTVEDFWRLVYDYECTTIVMLNTVDGSDETVVQYWPSGGGAQYGLMKVECISTTKRDSYIQSQFQVAHKKFGESLSVDHFAFSGWSTNQPDVSTLQQLIRCTGNKNNGPVLVHCINGVGLSAVYAIVKTESERLEQEGSIDVFQSLTKLRKICPHAIQTQEEYTLCYQLLKDHLDNPEEYAVVY